MIGGKMKSNRKDSTINMLLTYQEGMGAIDGLLKDLREHHNLSNQEIFRLICKKLKDDLVAIDGGGIICLRGECVTFRKFSDQKNSCGTSGEVDTPQEEINTYTKILETIRSKGGAYNWNAGSKAPEIVWLRRLLGLPQHPHVVCAGIEENPSIFLFYRGDPIRPFLTHEIQVLRILFGLISIFMYKEKEKRQAYFYSMSAHTFEKSYNTPVRNLSYQLRQSINPYNDQARIITFAIEDFIDLWANHFSASTYHGNETHDKEWIETFEIGDFHDDLERFATHIFNLRINDLFDHYKNDEIPTEAGDLQSLWEGEISRNSFFTLEAFLEVEGMRILGIRPFFRAMLINMLTNAIEALNLFETAINLEKSNEKPRISFRALQDENTTSITIENNGFPMKDMIFNRLDKLFKEAKEGRLQLNTSEFEMAMREKEFTTKPGIGTGRGLAEAAQYASNIVRICNGYEADRGWIEVDRNPPATRFKIHFPFGKQLVDQCKQSPYSFQSANNRVSFKWRVG